tara:strand:- start:1051 stop:1704 length:654 start_codon:yes stop_codon:yes gene_type:complete
MLLQGKKISKSYNRINVLNDIDISVSSGEIISIVGKSGAGKSTLLYILSSLENPDKGDVMVNGINLKSLSKNQLAHFRNQNIGFIFQFHNLLPEFDALENVCIPGYMTNKKKRDIEDRGKSLLDFLDLSERMHHRPSELSGGEQQRVAVARSLINNPSIIFADEPSGNLDSSNSKQLFNLIKKLNKEYEQTFVLVTHNLDFASIAKRTLKIEDGKIK